MKKLHTYDQLPEWLKLAGLIIGAEGDEGQDGSQDSGNDSGDDDEPNESGDSGSDDDTPEDERHDDADDPKVKGLKSSLAAERAANKTNAREVRRLQRELKAATKDQEERELREKSEVEQATAKQQKAEEKVTRLAAGLKRSAIQQAIESAAREAKFIDTDDAVQGVDWDKIDVEQDDDDPSDIVVDTKTVVAEVKALANRKKHLIQKGTDDGEKTGSSFAGGGGKKGKLDDEELKRKYPALQ